MEVRKEEKAGNSAFIIQGTILAASGIISSLIGLMYRLPLTRIIGDQGNGYYSAAYNIYTIILLLSSYSLPLAVSKMVSARVGNKEYKNALRILKASLGYATIVGGTGCLVIWLGAGWFANSFLHIPEAAYPLMALAPTVWIVSYLGVVRGYFQGHSTMVPTALSQIIEQIINALVSVGAAWGLLHLAVQKGLGEQLSRAYGAMGGTIGTGAGSAAALITMLFILSVFMKRTRVRLKDDRTEHTESYAEITKILVMTVVPVILSTAIYNMSSILDNAIFGQSMFALGLQDRTAADYGIYSAKYKLLINVPIMVANSLSSSLIPALSRANAARDRGQVEAGISNAIRFAMIIAIPSAVGLAVMADPIISLLFGESGRAVFMMHVGAAGVVFYSLSTVSNAILQGTSHMRIPVRHALMSMVIHVGILLFLLLGLKIGIYGVVISDMCFALSMCIMNGLSIRKLMTYRQEVRRTFVGPAFCAAVMGVVTWAAMTFLKRATGRVIMFTLLPILLAIAVYGSLLIKSGCITENELVYFPKGRKIIRLARKLRLL